MISEKLPSADRAIPKILGSIAIAVVAYVAVSVVADVSQLADAADRVSPGLGQPVFWFLLVLLSAVAAVPAAMYYRLPAALVPPAADCGPEFEAYLGKLRTRMAGNPRLAGMPLATGDDLEAAFAKLGAEADAVVKETAAAVFLSTAVMQNGRLDALAVLASQGRMVWRIASIYHGRPSPRQMLYLYGNVAANSIVAENVQEIDVAELAAPLLASIVPSVKGAVPGLQGVANLLVNSLASGSANAFLTLRTGLVAKSYCSATSRPDGKAVRSSATATALGLVGQIAKEQGGKVVERSWGVVRDLFEGTVDSAVKGAKEAATAAAGTVTRSAQSAGNAVSRTWNRVFGKGNDVLPDA
ncbi:DUF697 domain-containing protein [Dechloromonas sp. ZS-1]|uniref:DUF697 domain-containing protein n=1 Tax=Dechloromonas sp. ZS-1 TaxID=3138067 RepID=UPI0031FBB628